MRGEKPNPPTPFPQREGGARHSGRPGFGGGPGSPDAGETFAHLSDDLIETRLSDELRDHPLLLIPVGERTKLIDAALKGSDFVVSDYVRHGTLSHKNKAIYEAKWGEWTPHAYRRQPAR